MTRTKKRMLIMGGLVLLLVVVLALGKFLQIRKMIASSPKPGAQTVSAVRVQSLEWQPELSAVGTLGTNGEDNAKLRAKLRRARDLWRGAR